MVLTYFGIKLCHEFLSLSGHVFGKFGQHIVHHKEVIFVLVFSHIFHCRFQQCVNREYRVSAHQSKERGIASSKVWGNTICKEHLGNHFVPFSGIMLHIFLY